MAAIFHVGATTATGAANTRDGFNTHISIDRYTNTGLSLAFETNSTKGINIAQTAFWFVFGVIQE